MKNKLLLIICFIVVPFNILESKALKAMLPGMLVGILACPFEVRYLKSLSAKYKVNENLLVKGGFCSTVLLGGIVSGQLYKFFNKEYILADLNAVIDQVSQSPAVMKVGLLFKIHNESKLKQDEDLNCILKDNEQINTTKEINLYLNGYLTEDLNRYRYLSSKKLIHDLSYFRNNLNKLISRLQKRITRSNKDFNDRSEISIKKAKDIIETINIFIIFLNEHQALMIYDDSFPSLYPLFKRHKKTNIKFL